LSASFPGELQAAIISKPIVTGSLRMNHSPHFSARAVAEVCRRCFAPQHAMQDV